MHDRFGRYENCALGVKESVAAFKRSAIEVDQLGFKTAGADSPKKSVRKDLGEIRFGYRISEPWPSKLTGSVITSSTGAAVRRKQFGNT